MDGMLQHRLALNVRTLITAFKVEMALPAVPVDAISFLSLPPTPNSLWYRAPGTTWSTDWIPVGNGYLAGAHS